MTPPAWGFLLSRGNADPDFLDPQFDEMSVEA